MDEATPLSKKISKRHLVISKIKRQIFKHIWLTRALFLGGCLAILFLGVLLASCLFKSTGIAKYPSLARSFLFTPRDKIASLSGKTNILILGKGGEGHEAPDLTDTIMFVSVSFTKPSVTLISLPRDIWIPALRTKLNSAYYWGNQKKAGGGIVLAKSTVEEIVGQSIQYGLVIDFSGFKAIIDAVGGVEVNVERDFVDNKFPIPGRQNDDCGGDKEYKCRYETLQFVRGKQTMDGETALKFVRSRNAEGEEGTDLARAARQEKLIQAIKNRALSVHVLLSPTRLNKLLKALNQSIETDIDTNATAILVRKALDARQNTKSLVLSEDLLMVPPKSAVYDGLYVFVPKSGDWSQVTRWVEEKTSN